MSTDTVADVAPGADTAPEGTAAGDATGQDSAAPQLAGDVTATAGEDDTDDQSTDEGSTGQAPARQPERVEDLPPWAQKVIKEARQGEGDYRKRAQAAEADKKSTEDKLQGFLDGFAKVMGLGDDDATGGGTPEPPDPEKLTQQLAGAQREHRATQVELAVYRAAGRFDGDPDALLDSRSFLKKVLDFDPSEEDFGDKVSEAIRAAVSSNPKLKAAPAPAAVAPTTPPSGGEFASGPSGRVDTESLSVDDFRKRRQGRRGQKE